MPDVEIITFPVPAGFKARLQARAGDTSLSDFIRRTLAKSLKMPGLLDVKAVGKPLGTKQKKG